MYILEPISILVIFLFMIGAGIYALFFFGLVIRDIIKLFTKKKDKDNPYGW